MHIVIWTIVGLIAGATAAFYGQLGWAWLNEGFGLNPMLAFPLATVSVLIPLFGAMWHSYRDGEDEFEHIIMEKAHCSNCGQYRDLINGRCMDTC